MTTNIIKITAAELLPGDNLSGDVIATVDVQGAKTYVTYTDDDTRCRMASTQVCTVEREGGVSTVVAEAASVQAGTDWNAVRAAEAAQGARREHELQLSFRRDRYRAYGRG